MISRFHFAAQMKAGVMSRTLIALKKNGFKTAKYHINTDKYELIVDLEADHEISLNELAIIKSNLPDILSIKPDSAVEERQKTKQKPDSQSTEMLYRGQKATENTSVESDPDLGKIKKHVFTYRGVEISETSHTENEKKNEGHIHAKGMYRGQEID